MPYIYSFFHLARTCTFVLSISISTQFQFSFHLLFTYCLFFWRRGRPFSRSLSLSFSDVKKKYSFLWSLLLHSLITLEQEFYDKRNHYLEYSIFSKIISQIVYGLVFFFKLNLLSCKRNQQSINHMHLLSNFKNHLNLSLEKMRNRWYLIKLIKRT